MIFRFTGIFASQDVSYWDIFGVSCPSADNTRDTLYVPAREIQAPSGQSHKKPIAPVPITAFTGGRHVSAFGWALRYIPGASVFNLLLTTSTNSYHNICSFHIWLQTWQSNMSLAYYSPWAQHGFFIFYTACTQTDDGSMAWYDCSNPSFSPT